MKTDDILDSLTIVSFKRLQLNQDCFEGKISYQTCQLKQNELRKEEEALYDLLKEKNPP